MHRAYVRCNGGHYFIGSHCPLDGWTSPEAAELATANKKISAAELSIEALRRAGVKETTLSRTIVIDFGNEMSSFDAIAPEVYVIQGQWKKLRDLGEHFAL